MSLKRNILLGIAVAGVLAAQASAEWVNINDDSIQAGQTQTWSSSNKYILHGKVCIENGARLYIPAGTKVYADGNSADSASMLIVCRGGRLYAQGTAEIPIVFTSIYDTLSAPLPLTNDARGLWGGINIFGRAPLNVPGGVADLSGDITLADTSKLRYGDSTAANPYDTSGILHYVSIRYTGMSDKSQIKGCFLACVGKGTIIDHIESFLGAEDGINLTGGTVDLKYVISAFQAGDGLYSEGGYQGRIQYYFGIQNVVEGPAVNGCMTKIESDDLGAYPLTIPQIYNATYIGTGVSNPDTWKYKYGIYFKANGAGTIANSILTQCSNYGMYVEDKGPMGSATKPSCRARLDSGSLVLKSNIIYGFGKGDTIDSIAKALPFLQSYLTADSNKNTFADPQIAGFSWLRDGKLDPRPSVSGSATQNVAMTPADGFFDQTTYRGAFAPTGSLWTTGWSALATTDIFKADAVTFTKNNSMASKPAPNMRIAGRGNCRQLSWNQTSAGKSSVTLFATNGKSVRLYETGYQPVGARSLAISLKGIPAGLYVLKVQYSGVMQSGLVCKQ